MISLYTIGGGNGLRGDIRYVPDDLPSIGWTGFVDTRIVPAEKLGYGSPLMLANPGGLAPSGRMGFSQFRDARLAGCDFLVDDFVEAWAPVSERREVIAYVGNLQDDPWFQPPLSRRSYLLRFWECLALPLKARCSIAIDAYFPATDTLAWECGQRLRDRVASYGRRALCEPCPSPNLPHLFPWSCVITEWYWRWMKGAGQAMPPVTGEIIRQLNMPFVGTTWEGEMLRHIRPFMADCAVAGHTPCFNVAELVIARLPWAAVVPAVAT